MATAQDQEIPESDSEDELPTTEIQNASEMRREQNLRFKDLLSARAEAITAEDIKQVIKATKDSELSMANIFAKQDFASVIHDPREYQLEIFEAAKKNNIIAVLDTGSGKTLIAVLLLKYIIAQELIDRSVNKTPRISFFLVDSVTLVFQQAAVLQNNIDQKIDKFCGAMATDLWDGETWAKHLSKNMIIVCTAEVLYQCLLRSFVKMEGINLLIFDEAHHAKKDHPYARIVKDCYLKEAEGKRPKIFGMTASPVDAKVDVVKAARNLETMLHSRIMTASDLALLRKAVAKPTEECWTYDRLGQPFETPLYQELHSRFGDVVSLKKAFTYSLAASSNLGAWCSDYVWSFALAEECLPKFEGRAVQTAMGNIPLSKMGKPAAEIERIREAISFLSSYSVEPSVNILDRLSPKVRCLYFELARYFERHTDTKCIVFTEQRFTARILCDLFQKIGTEHLRPGVLVGEGADSADGIRSTFRQQVLTVVAFRKGEVNCLFATSVAEEGLDIPDCNLVVRFDLASTLTRYIQSRGRARHMNSTFAHMVERDNMVHHESVKYVQSSEELMRRFCASLPKDRLLDSQNDIDALYENDRDRRSYTVQSTGAKLTYNSALVVLAHYASSLQYEKEFSNIVTYHHHYSQNAFVCEAILPEKSPVRGAVGKPASKKLVAKQSAAFETCLILRKHGLLDDYFISTYHKRLPAMRNARLAISSKKCNQYDMMVKPKLWESSRGTIPTSLYAMILNLNPGKPLRRKYHPLVVLTREKLPQFPTFSLYLEDDIECEVICRLVEQAIEVTQADLDVLTSFTLRVFQDVFNKVYECDAEKMTYWIAPSNHKSQILPDTYPSRSVLDWTILQAVFDNPEIPWSATDPKTFIPQFVYDKWDGKYRYFTVGIESGYKASDPPPKTAVRRRWMKNIMEYSLSLYKNSRAKFLEVCDWDQPVFRAELVQLRRNLLDKSTEKEKEREPDAYICLQPLMVSAIPAPVAAFAFTFPAIISRIESYLIAAEACLKLDLEIPLDLALEALTKDSDNTEEHRALQIQFQRGMGKNYERLEFLGDCFLKMATSISLFILNPDNDEFDFHVQRMCLICNMNLFVTAQKLKLYEFIRSQGFSRRSWYPEGLTLLRGKAQKATDGHKHGLADKTIADVCEAFIGASLLSGRNSKSHRFDIAVKSVSILVDSPDHKIANWQQYSDLYTLPGYQTAVSDANELDLVDQIEKKLGYHFNYPKLLRSAFTHPSYPKAWARVPCYQRLEFLGDSLLDMACVEHLYENYPDKDPQWLTEHKMAMVSNKFLGSVAIKLGLHRHVLQYSAAYQSQVHAYAEEIEAAGLLGDNAPDAWTTTSDPPKGLADIVEAYIGAIFIDSNFNFEVVEDFFRKFLKQHFDDMTIYDTFANKHPTTFLHNRLTLDFGCSNYCLKAGEVAGIDGMEPKVFAAVMVHKTLVAEGVSSSARYAKLKVSQAALLKLEGIPPFKFREIYGCDCQADQKEA